MSENKKTFKVTLDGKEVELAVLKPNHKVQQQAQLVYNRAFREAVKPEDGKKGVLVRAALDPILREQKLWDDKKQLEFEQVNAKLLNGEMKLAKGGIKLREARDIAVEMRRDRHKINQLLADRNSLDLTTAEAQAENSRFNYLVSACTVMGDTGKPYWKNEDDYLASQNDPVVGKAGTLLGNILYGLDESYEYKKPENAFMLKWGFVDKDLHLIDKQGRKIDAIGRLVDDKGRLINEKGELVDSEGNLLTESGDYKVEQLPFLSDDDEPVPFPDVEKSEELPTPKEDVALATTV